DFCLGLPESPLGVGAHVSRWPGSARDALDRTRPVAFHGNLSALGAAVPLRRLIALPDCGTSGSPGGHLSFLQKGDRTMPHQIASREEWLAARLALLKEEKELTRRSDDLARRRQQLPWVRADKEYRFLAD